MSLSYIPAAVLVVTLAVGEVFHCKRTHDIFIKRQILLNTAENNINT